MRQDFCTIALNFFRQIAVYLAPILPRLAEQTAELLNLPPLAMALDDASDAAAAGRR